MKNQILIAFTTLSILVLAFSSCSKKSLCQTCTIDNAPTVRVEVCPDGATTYDGNTIILEGDLGGVPVSIYTSTLELSGYECKK